MFNRIVIVFGSLFVMTFLSAQVIVDEDSRFASIASVDLILNREILPVDRIKVDYSPFLAFQVAEANIQEEELGGEVVQPPSKLSDQIALAIIVEQFKPKGSLVLGSRGLLQFENGRTMKLNDEFNARIREQVYTVKISSITASGYTLSLGAAKIDRTFLQNSLNSGSVINKASDSSDERDSNPNL